MFIECPNCGAPHVLALRCPQCGMTPRQSMNRVVENMDMDCEMLRGYADIGVFLTPTEMLALALDAVEDDRRLLSCLLCLDTLPREALGELVHECIHTFNIYSLRMVYEGARRRNIDLFNDNDLMQAVLLNSVPIAHFILTHSDEFSEDIGKHALIVAIRNDNVPMLQMLLAFGASVKSIQNILPESYSGNVFAIEYMMSSGYSFAAGGPSTDLLLAAIERGNGAFAEALFELDPSLHASALRQIKKSPIQRRLLDMARARELVSDTMAPDIFGIIGGFLSGGQTQEVRIMRFRQHAGPLPQGLTHREASFLISVYNSDYDAVLDIITDGRGMRKGIVAGAIINLVENSKMLMLKNMLPHLPSLSTIFPEGGEHNRILFHVCKQPSLLFMLMEFGYDIPKNDPSYLDIAVLKSFYATVEYMLQAMRYAVTDDCLLIAINNQDIQMVAILVRFLDRPLPESTLVLAVETMNVNMTKLLLSRSVPIAPDILVFTVHDAYALFNEQAVRITRALMEAGAEVSTDAQLFWLEEPVHNMGLVEVWMEHGVEATLFPAVAAEHGFVSGACLALLSTVFNNAPLFEFLIVEKRVPAVIFAHRMPIDFISKLHYRAVVEAFDGPVDFPSSPDFEQLLWNWSAYALLFQVPVQRSPAERAAHHVPAELSDLEIVELTRRGALDGYAQMRALLMLGVPMDGGFDTLVTLNAALANNDLDFARALISHDPMYYARNAPRLEEHVRGRAMEMALDMVSTDEQDSMDYTEEQKAPAMSPIRQARRRSSDDKRPQAYRSPRAHL